MLELRIHTRAKTSVGRNRGFVSPIHHTRIWLVGLLLVDGIPKACASMASLGENVFLGEQPKVCHAFLSSMMCSGPDRSWPERLPTNSTQIHRGSAVLYRAIKIALFSPKFKDASLCRLSIVKKDLQRVQEPAITPLSTRFYHLRLP